MLAARFRRPWPIVAAIFTATILNHAAAGALGAWVTTLVSPEWMTKIVGASFIAMALWALVPDKIDEEKVGARSLGGVFWTTVAMFFLAEMGDKTQVATVMLAARYPSLWQVVMGTTLGMLIANVPVVFFGDAISKRVPLAIVRKLAAGAFAVLGVLALLQ